METLAWIVFWMMLCGGAWGVYTTLGKRALSEYLDKGQEPKDEWAEWKRLAAETRKRKQQEKDDWQETFQALLQASCKHDFDDQGFRQGWWRCVLCGYQKPWKWEEGCSCVFQEDKALTDAVSRKVVIHRSGNCCIHGMPRLIEYKKKQELETARVFSKGGYDLHGTADRYKL